MLHVDPAAVCHTEDQENQVLSTTLDPAKNLATQRARQMSPDELYSAGFRAGFENKGMRGSLSDYVAYIDGWREGRKARF